MSEASDAAAIFNDRSATEAAMGFTKNLYRSVPFNRGMTRLVAACCVVLTGMDADLACGQQCDPAGWVEQTLTYRQDHGMAFDTARNRLVVFGGGSVAPENAFDASIRDETWEWEPDKDATDGAGRWVFRGRGGPSARRALSMVYDAAGSRVVLFGGTEYYTSLGDTWEWNGTDGEWSLLGPAGPAPRHSTAMAYDSLRQRVLLFTGVLYGGDGELWALVNGASEWSLLSSGGPLARSGASMAYDIARDRVILYGGNGAPYFSDTWEWDGSAWARRIQYSPPGGRGGLQLAYDAARQRTVLFGGTGGAGNYPIDTWEWDGVQWERRALDGMTYRTDHRMAYDAARERVVLFGGWVPFGDSHRIWEWTGSSWVARPQTDPQPRTEFAMAYDAAIDRVVMFGGGNFEGVGYRGDTWEWSPSERRWRFMTAIGPSPRTGHEMVFDSARSRIVLFGGRGAPNQTRNAETWERDGSDWYLMKAAGPAARDGHAMVYDPVRDRVIMFGGRTAETSLNGETWVYQGAPASWRRLMIAGPSARYQTAMAYDPSRDVVVLCGGLGSAPYEPLGDTWELDASGGGDGVWREVTAPGSPALQGHRLAYDTVGERIIAFGGMIAGAGFPRDMWELDVSAPQRPLWRRIEIQTPVIGRAVFGGAFDTLRQQWVVFGGAHRIRSNVLPDTWTWSSLGSPVVPLQPFPASQSVAQGATLEITASALGTPPLEYQWRRQGIPLTDDGRIEGATAPTLRISDVRFEDAGDYDMVVTNSCGMIYSAPASVSVCVADFNADGVINSQDFLDFLAAFFAGDAGADLNFDGVVNSRDFWLFLQWFFQCR